MRTYHLLKHPHPDVRRKQMGQDQHVPTQQPRHRGAEIARSYDGDPMRGSILSCGGSSAAAGQQDGRGDRQQSPQRAAEGQPFGPLLGDSAAAAANAPWWPSPRPPGLDCRHLRKGLGGFPKPKAVGYGCIMLIASACGFCFC